MNQPTVAIVGAGIVGICCAIECQRRGMRVTLIDGSPPASETSSGNAGVICNSGIHPLAHPDLLRLAPRLLSNRDSRFLLRYRALPGLTSWLFKFRARCNEADYDRATRALIPLTRDALTLHESLMKEAGSNTLLQPTGWLKLFHDEAAWRSACEDILTLQQAGVDARALDSDALNRLEPGLCGGHRYGLWMANTHTVADPAALCRSYFELYRERGGRFLQRRVSALGRSSPGWSVHSDAEALRADIVVISLGAWANDLLRPLGLHLPIIQERGYHMMFDHVPGKKLGRSIIDPIRGYVITPMASGLRLTSATNPVARESEPDPRQLYNLIPEARKTIALGEAQFDAPWMGRRPSTPDSLPLIGPIDDDPTLIAATGHGHLGLTLGPGTGVLVAELLAGRASSIINPFSPDRLR